MHIIIHFLKALYLLWIGPRVITPIIPLMMGLPPTAATAKGNDLPEKNG